MIELRSTEGLYAQITDCRAAVLMGTFYDIPQEQADSLFRDYYAFVNEMLASACILDWTMGNRVVKDLDASLRENSSAYRSLYVEGSEV